MTGRRNIMRKFRIDEISAVDEPCQDPARAVIFKRRDPVPMTPISAASPTGADGFAKRRADALWELQKRADALAATGMDPALAYDAVLKTPEGAALYEASV